MIFLGIGLWCAGPNLIKMTKMSPEIEENMEGEVYSVAKHTLPFAKFPVNF